MLFDLKTYKIPFFVNSPSKSTCLIIERHQPLNVTTFYTIDCTWHLKIISSDNNCMVKRYNQNLSIVSGISKSETKSSATGGESVDNIDVVLSGKGFFRPHGLILTQYTLKYWKMYIFNKWWIYKLLQLIYCHLLFIFARTQPHPIKINSTKIPAVCPSMNYSFLSCVLERDNEFNF